MAATAGISMEKLPSSPAWNRIREQFYATGDAASVQNQLTEVGDTQVHAKLEARLPLFFTKQSPRLVKHLCQLTRARHGKYQDTLYQLEPDVKETPGGLRDLHFIHWISGMRPELRPEASLAAPAAFLSSLRCFLHFEASGDRNVLNFEAQQKVVKQHFCGAKRQR